MSWNVYYPCWKQLLNIFVETMMHFFQDYSKNRKFKSTAFIWNINILEHYKCLHSLNVMLSLLKSIYFFFYLTDPTFLNSRVYSVFEPNWCWGGGWHHGHVCKFSHATKTYFRKSCKPENGSMCRISHLKQSHLKHWAGIEKPCAMWGILLRPLGLPTLKRFT